MNVSAHLFAEIIAMTGSTPIGGRWSNGGVVFSFSTVTLFCIRGLIRFVSGLNL